MICGVLNIARRSSVRQLFLSCCGLRRDVADDKDDFDNEESDRLSAEFVNRVRAERAAAADALTGGGGSFNRSCASSNLQFAETTTSESHLPRSRYTSLTCFNICQLCYLLYTFLLSVNSVISHASSNIQ